jgi:hypothetical protein
MKFELRQMRTQGSGAIVNCSSLGGSWAVPNGQRPGRWRRGCRHRQQGHGRGRGQMRVPN